MPASKFVSNRSRRKRIRNSNPISEPAFPMLDDTDIRFVDTRVYYLRMNHQPLFRTDTGYPVRLQELSKPIDVQYYLELYQGVGLRCNWLDRLVISPNELRELINRNEVSIYLIFHEEDPCGFVEFERHCDHLEILYFGLLPEYIGKGIGSACLKKAIDTAWSLNPEWIELNTCDLDSNRALELYTNVGFELYTVKTETRRAFQ